MRARPPVGVRALADLVERADRVVALTGAGVSVPSGIPDFRSPGSGLWEGVDPMEVAHVDAFQHDPLRFWAFYGRACTCWPASSPMPRIARWPSSSAAAGWRR